MADIRKSASPFYTRKIMEQTLTIQHITNKHALQLVCKQIKTAWKRNNLVAIVTKHFLSTVYAALAILSILSFMVNFMLQMPSKTLEISQSTACLMCMTLVVGIVYGIQYYKAYKASEKQDI